MRNLIFKWVGGLLAGVLAFAFLLPGDASASQSERTLKMYIHNNYSETIVKDESRKNVSSQQTQIKSDKIGRVAAKSLDFKQITCNKDKTISGYFSYSHGNCEFTVNFSYGVKSTQEGGDMWRTLGDCKNQDFGIINKINDSCRLTQEAGNCKGANKCSCHFTLKSR